jgi:hypothetical protein
LNAAEKRGSSVQSAGGHNELQPKHGLSAIVAEPLEPEDGQVVRAARSNFFHNFSVSLIFGLPEMAKS